MATIMHCQVHNNLAVMVIVRILTELIVIFSFPCSYFSTLNCNKPAHTLTHTPTHTLTHTSQVIVRSLLTSPHTAAPPPPPAEHLQPAHLAAWLAAPLSMPDTQVRDQDEFKETKENFGLW